MQLMGILFDNAKLEVGQIDLLFIKSVLDQIAYNTSV